MCLDNSTVEQVFFSHASENGKRLNLQEEPFNIKPNFLQHLGGIYFIYWGGLVGGKETVKEMVLWELPGKVELENIFQSILTNQTCALFHVHVTLFFKETSQPLYF